MGGRYREAVAARDCAFESNPKRSRLLFMISTKLLALSAIAVVGLLSTSAEAHVPVAVTVSPVGVYIGPPLPPPPPPVVYAPAPVYYAPAPVYPAPVVYQRPVVVYDRYDRCDHRGHGPGHHHNQWRGHGHRQQQRGVRHRR